MSRIIWKKCVESSQNEKFLLHIFFGFHGFCCASVLELVILAKAFHS